MKATDTDSMPSQRAVSFLVRFWWEPREGEGREPILRGYLRNLRSGEEQYVGEAGQISDLVMRHLRAEQETATVAPGYKEAKSG